jgi:chromosome segregation ATPase
MEFPYGEQGSFLDVAEMRADLRKNGFKGRIDDELRERLGGGSLEKINPYKKAADCIHEEAVRYRCSPPEFLLDILGAYFGRYEERGWRRAQQALEEKDSAVSTLSEQVAQLGEERRSLMAEVSSVKEDLQAARVERERSQVRADEREKAGGSRIQELLTAMGDLRKTTEAASARVIAQDHTLEERTGQLEQVRLELQRMTAKSQEMAKEVAAAREELAALRVHRATDQSRLLEHQSEFSTLKAKDNAREEEIRRLNEDLRAAERREVEANQRANSLQLEVERLRGQLEPAKPREKAPPKGSK